MKQDYRESKEGKRRFRYKRFYRLTYWFQTILWHCGIQWHNTFSDECTSDFGCCHPNIPDRKQAKP